MSRITLKPNKYVREYDGAEGRALYNFDREVIEKALSYGSCRIGNLKILKDEVGSSCYDRVRLYDDDYLVYQAQETSSGDWYVIYCSIDKTSEVWNLLME